MVQCQGKSRQASAIVDEPRYRPNGSSIYEMAGVDEAGPSGILDVLLELRKLELSFDNGA